MRLTTDSAKHTAAEVIEPREGGNCVKWVTAQEPEPVIGFEPTTRV
jgi:hypothetical protein